MKTRTKILIAVATLIIVLAAVAGIYYLASMHKVPELKKEKLHENPINYGTVYVVAQKPYTDLAVFDTQIGLEHYWRAHHSGGNGIELILQSSKDGRLVVLSEPLPGLSNAQTLYGKDVKVSDLTVDQLQKINLAYNFTDEDGINVYADYTDDSLIEVTVLTLEDVLDFFRAPNRTTAKLYLRFMDEAQIPDMNKALKTIYDALAERSMLSMAIFCPQSDSTAAAVEQACPELMRAATDKETNALFRDCLSGKSNGSLPYDVIYTKTSSQLGSEKFIHYARNLGLAVVLSDVNSEDVATLRSYGVTAIATDKVEETIQIIRDAKLAEREAKTATD